MEKEGEIIKRTDTIRFHARYRLFDVYENEVDPSTPLRGTLEVEVEIEIEEYCSPLNTKNSQTQLLLDTILSALLLV